MTLFGHWWPFIEPKEMGIIGKNNASSMCNH